MHRSKTIILVIAALIFILPSALLADSAAQNTYVRLVQTGMEKMKAGDYQSARDSFVEAMRYNDEDFAAHLGLGLACFHLKQDSEAERELSRAAELNPSSAQAYQWLGEVYYRRDDLESALASWEKALALDPGAPGLKDRIDRVRRENQAEKNFSHELSSHFQIKYEGREKEEAGRIVRSILEDAYTEVGRALSFYPDNEIQVILYSGQQFREVTEAPGWSGGVYDGKIRLPIGGIDKETPGLRKLLFHEYTHAAVRAITPRCPTWLNEGLAQYFEGRQIDAGQAAMLRKLLQSGKLPRLSAMEGSFTGLDSGQATTVYLASLSVVRFLVSDYGMYRVRMVLDELAAGADTARAVNKSIGFTLEEFERSWRQSLE